MSSAGPPEDPIIVGHALDENHRPIDFAGTLARLAEWEGRDVAVIGHAQVPGRSQIASQVEFAGTLGSVQMFDNRVPGSRGEALAGFTVGSGGFYISSAEFIHAVPLLPWSQLRIVFEHEFSITVTLREA